MGLLISALDVRKVLAQSPIPVITSTEPDPTNSAFEVTIDFDASVDASIFSQLNYSNCNWSNPTSVSGDDSVWTLQITPITNGVVTVQVPANIYQDSAENWNTASNLFSRTYDAARDIGITNLDISKTVVGQGNTMNIKVTIFNYGNNTEHSNVTIYASTTVIHTYENIPLISRNFTTITFTWNTTGFAKGNYTIGTHAEPVEGETDFDDNNCTDGWVVVTWLGDLTDKDHLTPPDGVPDGKVDENDLWYFCGAFIDYYKIPKRLDANCDFDNNYKIDEDDLWTFCDAFIDYYKAQQH
jgi:hypothetical protein